MQLLVGVRQFVLLHGNLCVAQDILLLGQFTLSVEDLQVEVGVGQAHYHLSCLHMRTFLHHLFLYDATFLAAYLHSADGSHLAIHRHIVIEPVALDLADVQSLALHSQRSRKVGQSQCYQHAHEHDAACYPSPILARDEVMLLLNLYVHICISFLNVVLIPVCEAFGCASTPYILYACAMGGHFLTNG